MMLPLTVVLVVANVDVVLVVRGAITSLVMWNQKTMIYSTNQVMCLQAL